MENNSDGKNYIKDRVIELDGTWQQKCEILRDEVKEKFGIVLTSGEQLRWICRRIDGLIEKTKKISDSIPDKEPYEVRDWHYFFETKDGVLKLSLQDADEIFADFSKHGGNYSWEKMRQKYGFNPRAWQTIKNRLQLYKDSHVVSPETLDQMTEEEKDSRIVDVIDRHWADRVIGKMVVTNEKKFKKEAERAMRFMYNQLYFLTEVKKFIEWWNPRTIDFDLPDPVNEDWKHYFISDIHIGKIDTAGVLERLEIVKRAIIESPESIAYITIGGDLGETFAQDGNHPWQIIHWTEDKWGRWFDLMLNIAKIFEDFLLDIRKAWKVVRVHGITGNHGRTTSKKEDDIERTAELVIYELIKRALSNTDIQLDYHKESLHLIDIGSVRFVMIHGDAPLGNQTAERLLLPHQRPWAYHVLATGDRHTLQMKEWFGHTYVRTPALAGKWAYDKSMNLHSEPGFIMFKPNEYGSVDIIVKRLK